jgi:hypothetical protein
LILCSQHHEYALTIQLIDQNPWSRVIICKLNSSSGTNLLVLQAQGSQSGQELLQKVLDVLRECEPALAHEDEDEGW